MTKHALSLPPSTRRLAVPLERKRVAALPSSAAGGADKVVGTVTLLAKTTVLTTRGGEPTAFAVLHDRLGDPLDARAVADGRVRWVHSNHLMSICAHNS